MIGESVVKCVQGFIYPAFPRFQVIAFIKLQFNQHLPLNLQSCENCEMLRAFNNNDNSFNTTHSFNTTATLNHITSDDRAEILAWLSPLEPRVRHRDIVARRIDSIGAWLLETEEFKRWQNGSREDGSYHPTLFCYGNPGVGKTYLR